MENLARYIIRASFAQDRISYLPPEAQVIYESRDGKRTKTFDALEQPAAMCSHVPNKVEQMVRYYGYYSNVCRGKRKAREEDDLKQDPGFPFLIDTQSHFHLLSSPKRNFLSCHACSGGRDMKGKAKRKPPEIVLRDGKPSAVILDIDEYQEMLERIEDVEDLEMLEEMRKKPLKFKRLEDFLKEYNPSV
jgi:hypothetical protein